MENLLGKENEGFEIIMSSNIYGCSHRPCLYVKIANILSLDFNHERLWLACTSLRLARVCANDSYLHAITRETFGKKLIENQVIRSKISSFGRAIDSAFAYMEQLVYMMEHDRWATDKSARSLYLGGPVANLKVLAGRVLEHVNRESQQIMGGLGYSKNGRGARIEQISRDVRVMVVGGGSEEILADLAVNQEMKAMNKMSRL